MREASKRRYSRRKRQFGQVLWRFWNCCWRLGSHNVLPSSLLFIWFERDLNEHESLGKRVSLWNLLLSWSLKGIRMKRINTWSDYKTFLVFLGCVCLSELPKTTMTTTREGEGDLQYLSPVSVTLETQDFQEQEEEEEGTTKGQNEETHDMRCNLTKKTCNSLSRHDSMSRIDWNASLGESKFNSSRQFCSLSSLWQTQKMIFQERLCFLLCVFCFVMSLLLLRASGSLRSSTRESLPLNVRSWRLVDILHLRWFDTKSHSIKVRLLLPSFMRRRGWRGQ